MLGSSLSSSCMDGEEGTRVATHAAVGLVCGFRVGPHLHVCCMYVGKGEEEEEEGGVSLSL